MMALWSIYRGRNGHEWLLSIEVERSYIGLGGQVNLMTITPGIAFLLHVWRLRTRLDIFQRINLHQVNCSQVDALEKEAFFRDIGRPADAEDLNPPGYGPGV